MSTYLHDHLDTIVGVIRNSVDLLAKQGTPWSSTFWTRTEGHADALRRHVERTLDGDGDGAWGQLDVAVLCSTSIVNGALADPRERLWGVRVRWVPADLELPS